jgi:hypothetical protein
MFLDKIQGNFVIVLIMFGYALVCEHARIVSLIPKRIRWRILLKVIIFSYISLESVIVPWLNLCWLLIGCCFGGGSVLEFF